MVKSGPATFLFTDIEGSTRMWEQEEVAMRTSLARHDELLRSAVEDGGGEIVKMTGDGVHAAFDRAEDAIAVAAAAQRSLAAEDWGESGALTVRMAIHTGGAQARDGDYYGSAVNRAARLMSIAHGGQVLVSQATELLARDVLPDDVDLRDLGEHRLRDLTRPERVFQLVAPGLGTEFPRSDPSTRIRRTCRCSHELRRSRAGAHHDHDPPRGTPDAHGDRCRRRR